MDVRMCVSSWYVEEKIARGKKTLCRMEMFKLVQQTRQQLRMGMGSYRSQFGHGWFWKLLVGHDAAPVNGSC
jgi:hypothetical protein